MSQQFKSNGAVLRFKRSICKRSIYWVLFLFISSFSFVGSLSAQPCIDPVVDLGPDIVQCGGRIQLDALNTGADYLWSDASTGQTLNIGMSGTYSVTVTNQPNCSASASINITINPVPVVDLGADIHHCSNTFRDILFVAIPETFYSWSTGETTQQIAVTSTGNYSVTVTNSDNCTASDELAISVDPSPTVSLGDDITTCATSVRLMGGAFESYSWSTGASANFVVVNSSGTYRLTVSNTFHCTASSSVNVLFQSSPQLGADMADTICPFTTTDLTNYFVTSGLSVSYLHTDFIPVATPHTVADGNYLVVVSNVYGCSDTGLITISLHNKPNLGVDKSDSICPGYAYDLTTLYPNSSYSTYLWNVSKPDSVFSGIYTLMVSNSDGCFDTATAIITNKQQPIVTLNMPANICYNEPTFTLTGGSPPGGIYYINGRMDSLFNTVQIGLSSPLRIVYVYTNASGCTDSAETTVTIRPQPFITTVLPPSLCLTSTPIDLDDYFDISAGNSPGSHHYSGLGVSDHFFYPVLVPKSSPLSITDIYIDIYGCIDTSTYAVTVLDPVNVTMISSIASRSICEGQSVTLTASGADTYEFFLNGKSTGEPTSNPSYSTNSLQDKDIVVVVGRNDCSTDTSEPVSYDVHALPIVEAGPDSTISLGMSIQLSGDARGNDLVIYEWKPTTHLNFPSLPNPTFNGSESTLFYLYATDAYSCTGYDSVLINVVVPDSIELPNVITPDGDGKNDTWKVHPRVNLEGSNLIIFNRWGTKVYEAESYNNDWGGNQQKRRETSRRHLLLCVPRSLSKQPHLPRRY
ncbi:MAG: gliding motility-associated C-terminal domain-containing protein [Bacteroidetes bacterium]|nr:gliding motility-associated C-terminal domain-containing protein [Bacteroidota bacterium]